MLVRIQRRNVSPAVFWNGGAVFNTTSTYHEATLNNNGSTWTLPGVDLSVPGNYRILVRAFDNAGNHANASANDSTNFAVE